MKFITQPKWFVFLGLCIQFAFSSSQAQEYQRAKEVLKAVIIKESILYQGPTPASKKIIRIPQQAHVLVYGKLGNFLEIGYQNLKGWVILQNIIVQGPAESQAPATPVRSETNVKPAKVSRPKNPDTFQPIRLNPYTSFVMSGKSFYGQMRLGTTATYAVSSTLSVGGQAEAVFIQGTYFSLGPTLRHHWNTNAFFFNPAMDVSFLYYSFNHDSDKDKGFGFQWAVGNDILIFRDKTFEPSITMRFGADMMFFMFDEVRIPIWVALGAGFKF